MLRHLRRMVRGGLALGAASGLAFGATYVAQHRPAIVPVSVTVQAPEVPSSVPNAPSATTPSPTGGGVGESMLVAVRPGGPLRVVPKSVTVVLRRDGPRLVASVGPIRVVDPRGSLAGWNLRVRVAEGTARGESRYEVAPGEPMVVDGEGAGLVGGSPGPVGDDRWTTLMSAHQGHGGGTYQVSFMLRGSGDDLRSVRLVFDVS
jgi:hypothetical protein